VAQDINTIQKILACESNVRRIITQQEQDGVEFDVRQGNWYVHVLEERKIRLYEQIRPCLSLEVIEPYSVPIRKPFLKDGSYSKSVHQWYDGEIPDVCGMFTRVTFAEPSLGSRKKLQAQLLRLGWKPRSFTEKGNPKLTIKGEVCPSLYEIVDTVGKDIADWYVYNHRQSQIKGWLRRVRPDHRLPAEAITIGTPTFRFTHKIVVNVPKASKKVVFGREMRSLFTAYVNEVLVGHDASGLELRMLAHYMNDSSYIQLVLNGNIHEVNQKAAGLPTYDSAKTFIYAFLYGAGNPLIGALIGGTATDGGRIKRSFLAKTPALASLIKRVQAAAARGFLVGLDGRKITLRRDQYGKIQLHKALNTLLQTAGAVVMKYSMIFLDDWIHEEGLRSTKVIDMHDEGQYSVHPDDVQRHKELAVLSIVRAGEYLNLRIPLDGEAKAGKNWAQTH